MVLRSRYPEDVLETSVLDWDFLLKNRPQLVSFSARAKSSLSLLYEVQMESSPFARDSKLPLFGSTLLHTAEFMSKYHFWSVRTDSADHIVRMCEKFPPEVFTFLTAVGPASDSRMQTLLTVQLLDALGDDLRGMSAWLSSDVWGVVDAVDRLLWMGIAPVSYFNADFLAVCGVTRFLDFIQNNPGVMDWPREWCVPALTGLLRDRNPRNMSRRLRTVLSLSVH